MNMNTKMGVENGFFFKCFAGKRYLQVNQVIDTSTNIWINWDKDGYFEWIYMVITD